jgi:hypothetical protein
MVRRCGGKDMAYRAVCFHEQDKFNEIVDSYLEKARKELMNEPSLVGPIYYQRDSSSAKERVAEMRAAYVRSVQPPSLGEFSPVRVDVAVQTGLPVVDGVQSAISTDPEVKGAEEEQEDESLERSSPSAAVRSGKPIRRYKSSAMVSLRFIGDNHSSPSLLLGPEQSDSCGSGSNPVGGLVDLTGDNVGSRDDSCSDYHDDQLCDSDVGNSQDCHSLGLVPGTIRPPAVLGQLGLVHSELVDEKISRTVDSLQAELGLRKSLARVSLKRARDDDLDGDINDISAKIVNLLNLCNTSQESKDLSAVREMKRRPVAWYAAQV